MTLTIASMFKTASLINSAKPLFVSNLHSMIGEVVIDATVLEVIEYSAKITEHPIETKEAISDHIFKEPLKIRVEGSVTDSAIRFMGIFEMPLQKNSIETITNNLKSLSPFHSSDSDNKPSQKAYTLLKQIYEQRKLVNVVIKLEAFSDMAIEKLTFTNDENTGEQLQFTAEMKKIKFAQSRTQTHVRTANKQVQALTAKKVDVGIKEKKEEPVAERVSRAHNILNKGIMRILD